MARDHEDELAQFRQCFQPFRRDFPMIINEIRLVQLLEQFRRQRFAARRVRKKSADQKITVRFVNGADVVAR